MEHVADLPAKLDMMLKAGSLSRVALAQRLAVDKSLVGRWLAGSVHPTEHNLARLTTIAAEASPGFRLADWYDAIESIAKRHNCNLPHRSASTLPVGLGPLAAFLDAARPDLAGRGGAYEGFWRTSRPSLLVPDEIFHDYGLLRRTDDGLIEVLMEGSGLNFSGWLFPIAGNVFVFLFDSTGRTPMTVVFKGVSLPKAMVLDGILTMAALDPDRTPMALPIIIERVEDISGDRDADLSRLAEIVRGMPEPIDPVQSQRLQERLFREVGAIAAATGGESLLAISGKHSLSRGTTIAGLSG